MARPVERRPLTGKKPPIHKRAARRIQSGARKIAEWFSGGARVLQKGETKSTEPGREIRGNLPKRKPA